MPAACELLWESLKKDLSYKYKKLERLIKEVSLGDTGKAETPEFSLSQIVRSFEIWEDKEAAFNTALEIVLTYVKNIVKEDEKAEKLASQVLCDKSVIKFDKFIPAGIWKRVINGENTQHITHIYWYDKEQEKFLVQVAPKKENGFCLHGKPLKEDPKACFIHKNKFFGVFKKEEDLLSHIKSL
jgi:uncharacterized UPF0160 family protein